MTRSIFSLLFLAFIFGAGYYFGASNTSEIKKSYMVLKEEVMVKTRGLESELSSIRVRLNLFEAKEFLKSARADLHQKNFGEAGAKLERAKERIEKAASLSPEFQKKALTSIQSEIGSAQEGIRRLDPQVAAKIEEAEKALEKIIG